MSGNLPGPVVTQGLVWTVGQWNAFFASLGAKVDAANGDAASLLIHSGNASGVAVTATGGGTLTLADWAAAILTKADAATTAAAIAGAVAAADAALALSPSYDNDVQAAAGGVPLHARYRDRKSVV